MERDANKPGEAQNPSKDPAIPPSPRTLLAVSTLEFTRAVRAVLRRVFRSWEARRENSKPTDLDARSRAPLILMLVLLLSPGARAANRTTQIPFRLVGGHLIQIHGSIGNLNALHFLVDTGANPTSIDRRIAQKLRLSGTAERLALFHGDAPVDRTALPIITVGPINAEGVSGLVQDLSPVEKKLGVRIDAIVGLDVLGQSSFTIDYESRHIVFGPVEASKSSMSIGPAAQAASLNATVGRETVRLLLDTGAADLVLFDCESVERLRNLRVMRIKQFLNSASKSSDAKEILIPQVNLGTIDLGPLRALLVEDPRLCGLAFGGVVGPASLHLKRISFDFDHRLVAWAR